MDVATKCSTQNISTPRQQISNGRKAQSIRPLSDYRVCMKRRPQRSDLLISSQLSVSFDKITNRISFARIKIASDQFRVKNRPYLKLNFRLGLFSNRSWSKAPEVSYGLFFFFFAPSMNGWAQLYWSFPNFNLNFGSGRHFAGNTIYEWSGVTLPVFSI